MISAAGKAAIQEVHVSGPRYRRHFVPDTWVTLFAFLQVGGVDAVESELSPVSRTGRP
jgi:hypothetical protein